MSPKDVPWTQRRRLMYVVAAFCMGTIIYVLASGNDTRAGDTAIMFSFVGLLGIVGSYVFAAAWQDISMARYGATSYGGYGGYGRNGYGSSVGYGRQPHYPPQTGAVPPPTAPPVRSGE